MKTRIIFRPKLPLILRLDVLPRGPVSYQPPGFAALHFHSGVEYIRVNSGKPVERGPPTRSRYGGQAAWTGYALGMRRISDIGFSSRFPAELAANTIPHGPQRIYPYSLPSIPICRPSMMFLVLLSRKIFLPETTARLRGGWRAPPLSRGASRSGGYGGQALPTPKRYGGQTGRAPPAHGASSNAPTLFKLRRTSPGVQIL